MESVRGKCEVGPGHPRAVINLKKEIIIGSAGSGALSEEEKQAAAHALERLGRPHRRKSLLLQAGLFAMVLVLWRIPVINPIKLLVVLFHELSHVAMAYLTGGVVFGVAIHPGGAGVTIGYGGNDLLIVSAGYIGSLVIGCLLYVMSSRWDNDQVWAMLCIFVCLTLAFGWLNNFTAVFGYGTMTLLILGYFRLSTPMKKFFLRWTATTCCLYPILDVSNEVFQSEATGFIVRGETAQSDVMQLAAITGIGEPYLAVFWIAHGAGLTCFLILWAARQDAEARVRAAFIGGQHLTPVRYYKFDQHDPENTPTYVIR
jgi:hypothetical protein